MNGSHTITCESCSNEVVRHGGPRPPVSNLVVAVPTNERETYEERDYELCAECRRKVVDFIEGMDETETRVDMVELELAERTLSESADDLADLATELGALSRGETTDAEDDA